MQSIVSKGKDIFEAINLGLDILEASKNEVDIEILQHETNGFLGIGSKTAIVKITKLEASPIVEKNQEIEVRKHLDLEQLVSKISDEQIESNKFSSDNERFLENENEVDSRITDQLEGKVWVMDGQLYCKPSPFHFPMVTIKHGVQLYKNNQLIKDTNTIVSDKDVYELKVENEEQDTRWKISIDEHKLKVFLEIEPGYKMIRSIPNIEPDHHIEISVVEQRKGNNTLEYSEVIQKLESFRVKHGFNHEEIIKALEVTEPSTFEIATGIKAKSGKNGWIEVLVAMNSQNGPKEKEDGRVDYREINSIPNVERGKVIAIIHPPIPGQIGYTVTNEPLPAKQTFPIIVKTGKGVMIVEDKIVAIESGRPFIEQRGQMVKVSIMPKLTHPGNVDLSSGNIRFMGDVEILGEVEESMIVEAAGDILVHKSVNMATLTSSGAIVSYGNIIGSEISAGKNNMLVSELGHLLGIIHQHTEKIIVLIKQLMLTPAFKSNDVMKSGLQPLIRIMLEQKFKNLPPLAKKYVEIVNRGKEYLNDDIWSEISVDISLFFLSLTNETISLERIIDMSQKMKELHELSKTPVEPNSYITISSSLNSLIYCSGNILIQGQGCVNTKIHAGGTVNIKGTIRGGEVYGSLGVNINEVGSESGTCTIISVPIDQKIMINKAMDGTILKFGNIKYTLKDTRFHLVARLDENERVVFEQ